MSVVLSVGVAHGDDGKVVLARPRFPMLDRVLREERPQFLDFEMLESELPGQALREARLERRHCDPAVVRRVEIISGEAATQQRAGTREALAKRLREGLGRIGER